MKEQIEKLQRECDRICKEEILLITKEMLHRKYLLTPYVLVNWEVQNKEEIDLLRKNYEDEST